MTSYPSIYRARAVQVNGASIQAFVPQVFGEAPITVDTFLADLPVQSGMGWVMFQGGNPEFPVWAGNLAGGEAEGGTLLITRDYRWRNVVTETDPGHGFVQVNNLDPALATEVYLSLYDRSETAFLMAKTLKVGDLLSVYVTGDITTRIEYSVSGSLTDNIEWLSFPVTVAANYGFHTGVPGNNVSVQVVAQVTGHATPVASQIAFTPVGSIAATDVQGAIAEVASEAATAIADVAAQATTASTAITPGGVAGDILVKQSAVNSAATWGTSLPRLTLSSTTGLANLTQADTALMLGVATGPNMIFDRNSIQARDNGVAATISLNEFGGTIQLGGGGTPAQQVRIGDDAYLQDVNAAHTIGLKSTSDSTRGYLKLGDAGPTLLGLPTYWQLAAPAGGNGYLDGNTIYLRNAAGTAIGNFTGTTLNIGTVAASSAVSAVTLTATGAVYASNWFRGYGDTGLYNETHGTGLQCIAGPWVSVYGGLGLALSNGQQLRLYGAANATHLIQYSSEAATAIDPGSGQPSDGPKIQGWTTVWLRTAQDGKSFLFFGSNSYLTAAGVYSKFSSRELKDDIKLLDPEACLADVRRWQPVDYLVKDDLDKGRIEGFIAEDIYEVTPQLCVMTPPDSEHPNRPHALDYSGFTVRLTGAVQALLQRIEQLERDMV